MERIITIDVPDSAVTVNTPNDIGVRQEVERVVDALKREGCIGEDDEIIVNLRPSHAVSINDPSRNGQIETIWREDENGKGAIDSTKVGFTIELAQDVNN